MTHALRESCEHKPDMLKDARGRAEAAGLTAISRRPTRRRQRTNGNERRQEHRQLPINCNRQSRIGNARARYVSFTKSAIFTARFSSMLLRAAMPVRHDSAPARESGTLMWSGAGV